MNPDYRRILGSAAVGMAVGIVNDLRTFQRAREADKTIGFDWPLFWSRAAEGALTGATGGTVLAAAGA